MCEPDWQTEDGAVRLYCGDCRELLPTLAVGDVDCVYADPPYGIAHDSHGQRFVGHARIAGDESTETAEFVRLEAARLAACCVMHYSPYRPLSGFRSVLAWIKGEHVGIGGDRRTCWKRDFELIGVERNGQLAGQRDSGVITGYPALSPPPSGHAHEKPVGLVRTLLAKVKATSVVDPCMGSGTTGVACVSHGRRFVGCEIERNYIESGTARITAELERLRLFEAPPKIVQRSFLT